MTPDTSDTIFALSSGASPAAIAVVRVSGPDAGAALRALAGTLPRPRHATLGVLRRPGDAEPLDRALLLWFPGPASATGEDVAELHLHGGRAVVRAVLDVLRTLPRLRDAQPGEFTRRAFANGMLDLAEAEGLADLLEAETERQRRQALAAAEGGLSRLVAGWRERLTAAAAMIEAELDHADEEDGAEAGQGARGEVESLAADIGAALARPPAERLRQGVRVVLAGPPNSGKSTLLNALAGQELAITSPIPGTTRDLVSTPLALDGVALELTDTAGLRDTADPIEAIGVSRARQAVERADLLLWLGDPNEAPEGHAILIKPKADLRRTPVPQEDDAIAVSAVTGEGLEKLREQIRVRSERLIGAGDELLFNARQRARLAETRRELGAMLRSHDLLVQAEHLRSARHALAALTGHEEVEQMLDALFGRFCIGK